MTADKRRDSPRLQSAVNLIFMKPVDVLLHNDGAYHCCVLLADDATKTHLISRVRDMYIAHVTARGIGIFDREFDSSFDFGAYYLAS